MTKINSEAIDDIVVDLISYIIIRDTSWHIPEDFRHDIVEEAYKYARAIHDVKFSKDR